MPVPEGAQLSEDGQWWWDGAEWQAVDEPQASYDTETTAVGQLSDDGQWQWDGTAWQAAGGEQAEESLDLVESDFPYLFEMCDFSADESGGYDYLASIGVGKDDLAGDDSAYA